MAPTQIKMIDSSTDRCYFDEFFLQLKYIIEKDTIYIY